MPQVWKDPALTAAKWNPPATGTGVARATSVPSPSCPKKLSPQQYATPLGVTPHVCHTPALIVVNLSSFPATGAGLDRYQTEDAVSSPS